METVCFSRKRGKNGGPWALRLAAKASFAIQDWVDAWKKGSVGVVRPMDGYSS
jgi:hypothetical protein